LQASLGALPWRIEFTVGPSRLAGLHWVFDQRFVDMLALWTFKCPQIGMGGAKLDPRQHHAALTLRAARPFYFKYPRF
jgi:hypothetical protein